MDYQQEHIRAGYDFAVLNARDDAKLGCDPTIWVGQLFGLAVWAEAAPDWEVAGHQNEIRFLRTDYARRHST